MEKEVQFQIKITSKDLWQFSMIHANSGFLGLFNVIFTVAMLIVLITSYESFSTMQRVALTICVLLFSVWQPFLLFLKAWKQSKNPLMKEPMDLTFGEVGLHVKQGVQEADFSWEQMARISKTPWLVIIYMDRVHAYLLPNAVWLEKEAEFLEIVRTHLPKDRRRGI